jgi:hypothetical protein
MVYFRSNIGRLGNQLFILAYALYLRKEYGINYVLSDPHFQKFFRFPFYSFTNWIKSQFFFRVLIRVTGYKKVNITDNVGYFSGADIQFTQANVKCTGYFQSPLFFEKQTMKVKQSLCISKSFQKKFTQKYGHIYRDNHVTVLHSRRTDYKEHKISELGDKPVILPIEYYKKAVKHLKESNTQFVLIGDDINFLNSAFKFLENAIIIHESEIIDFQSLIHADACIISNSTFAWWGAYLNSKENCQIIAPNYFLGYNAKKEFPSNIYPKEWLLID